MRQRYGLGEFKNKGSKVVSMARRRHMKKSRSTHRGRSSGGMLSGWVPLSGREIMLDFGIGAVTAPLNAWLLPYQRQYLGMFGPYSDEAALAIVGAVAHKFGSGLIKDGGKELFRVAVISAGQQAGNSILPAVTTSAGASTDAYTY